MKTWRERIVEARARGVFTRDERALAQDWTTCAVGEQRDAHPEIVTFIPYPTFPKTFHPVDQILMEIGSCIGFYGCVITNDFDGAESAIDAIEDRVLQLKREAQP